MSKAYKKYKKNFTFSYSFGVFPTLELLRNKSEQVIEVFTRSNAEETIALKEIQNICKNKNIRYSVNDQVVERLTPRGNNFVIGIFKKHSSRLKIDQNSVILFKPSNRGNLGTIVRTSLGFGVKDVGIIRPGADIFDPEVVRASMGAVFKVNFQYFDSFDNVPLKNNFYLFYTDGRNWITKTKFISPYSLVFGSEGPGLPESLKTLGQTVTIPQTDDVDSLNLAVSVGIALYEASKKRI
ncbi:MAG: TrmH family RNA methyltransferase [Patescibacteria group bacterium]|nr:TrmH family RNA methyltransferase [Patescibacteria group bacterium]